MMRYWSILLCLGMLSACVDQAQHRAKYVKIDGSSTVFPITEAITEDFYEANPQYKVVVGISGTGGGIRKLCRGDIDLCNASRPIEPKELDACYAVGLEILSLPLAFDGIVIAVPKSNSWAQNIRLSELRQLWEPAAQGKNIYWSDLRPEWPKLPVQLFGAGSSSGTYDFFTEVVIGKARSSRGDYTSSESDNIIVQGLLGSRGGLAYFGYTYFIENAERLRALPVIDDIHGGVVAVAPNDQSIADGSYKPFRRTQYMLITNKALERDNVYRYVHYYFSRIEKLADELHFVPLPAADYVAVREKLSTYNPSTP